MSCTYGVNASHVYQYSIKIIFTDTLIIVPHVPENVPDFEKLNMYPFFFGSLHS